MRKKNNSNFNTSFLKGKTILVTGGTGTFGSNFIETLLRISSPKKNYSFF